MGLCFAEIVSLVASIHTAGQRMSLGLPSWASMHTADPNSFLCGYHHGLLFTVLTSVTGTSIHILRFAMEECRKTLTLSFHCQILRLLVQSGSGLGSMRENERHYTQEFKHEIQSGASVVMTLSSPAPRDKSLI